MLFPLRQRLISQPCMIQYTTLYYDVKIFFLIHQGSDTLSIASDANAKALGFGDRT